MEQIKILWKRFFHVNEIPHNLTVFGEPYFEEVFWFLENCFVSLVRKALPGLVNITVMIKVTTESDPTAVSTRLNDIAGDFVADGVEIGVGVAVEVGEAVGVGFGVGAGVGAAVGEGCGVGVGVGVGANVAERVDVAVTLVKLTV